MDYRGCAKMDGICPSMIIHSARGLKRNNIPFEVRCGMNITLWGLNVHKYSVSTRKIHFAHIELIYG